MTTLYVPADCHPLCSLRPYVIGGVKAEAIAALYRGPGSNLSAYRRKAEVILGAPIAKSSFARHLDHLREGTTTFSWEPRYAEDFPSEWSYDQTLSWLEAQRTDDPDMFYDLAIKAIMDAGSDAAPDDSWRDAERDAFQDLDAISEARTAQEDVRR